MRPLLSFQASIPTCGLQANVWFGSREAVLSNERALHGRAQSF
jgi:hypothetical protein